MLVDQVDDPKYCRFHRLISHPLKDCFVLKDKIQELLDNKVIVMSTPEEAATANPVSVTPEGFPQEMLKEESKGTDEEESFEDSSNDDSSDEGEWTLYESKGMKRRRRLAGCCRRNCPTTKEKA